MQIIYTNYHAYNGAAMMPDVMILGGLSVSHPIVNAVRMNHE